MRRLHSIPQEKKEPWYRNLPPIPVWMDEWRNDQRMIYGSSGAPWDSSLSIGENYENMRFAISDYAYFNDPITYNEYNTRMAMRMAMVTDRHTALRFNTVVT